MSIGHLEYDVALQNCDVVPGKNNWESMRPRPAGAETKITVLHRAGCLGSQAKLTCDSHHRLLLRHTMISDPL